MLEGKILGVTRFIVDSVDYDGESKIPGAFKTLLTYMDYRTVPTLKAARSCFWAADWFATNEGHHVDEELGMVVGYRIRKTECWVVDVDSIEDLLNIIGRQTVCIRRSKYKEVHWEIYINDGDS